MDTLEHIPFYDHHAHAFYHEALWREAPLAAYFTEAYDPVIQQRFAPDTLFFRRSMRDLGELYGCEPNAGAISAVRAQRDYAELCTDLLERANIQHLLIDDGFWPDRLWSVKETQARLPLPVRRVVRIENELEKLLPQHDTCRVAAGRPRSGAARGGENRRRVQEHHRLPHRLGHRREYALELERSFGQARRVGGQLNEKPLLDGALLLGLRVAAELGLPVQFHTGYGDPDLDMRLANPLHLRSVIERPELRELKVVLLHCYPYVREAGYLASVYRGVYFDLGLTIPYTSVAAMRGALHEALHLSPITKVLISSDAQRTPELYWLAARWARRTLSQALRQTVEDGDLSAAESQWAAERLLWSNASELYAR